MKAVISLVPFGLGGLHHIRKQVGGKVFYAHKIETKRLAVTYGGPAMGQVYTDVEERGDDIDIFAEYWAPLEPVIQGGAGVSRMGGSSVSYKPTHAGYPG